MKSRLRSAVWMSLLVVCALSGPIGRSRAASLWAYRQINLVSNMSGARHRDPKLVKPWGIAFAHNGPFMVSDESSGFTTVYDGSGATFPVPRPLIIPSAGRRRERSTPTGIVFNPLTFGFTPPGTNRPAIFIFDTLEGTIAAWNGVDGRKAVTVIDNSATASYTGLALGESFNFPAQNRAPRLYAANFRGGTVDTFDINYKRATTAGGFVDPDLPAHFAPFGIAFIEGELFVSYAIPDASKKNPVNRPGHGIVDRFDTDGRLIQRLVAGGSLDSPLGMVMAPQNFGLFSNDLLVGNFGDGTIDAFNPTTGEFLGQLWNRIGEPIVIPGLRGLIFGNGLEGGDPDKLYFVSGSNRDSDGLFGSLAPTPLTQH